MILRNMTRQSWIWACMLLIQNYFIREGLLINQLDAWMQFKILGSLSRKSFLTYKLDIYYHLSSAFYNLEILIRTVSPLSKCIGIWPNERFNL